MAAVPPRQLARLSSVVARALDGRWRESLAVLLVITLACVPYYPVLLRGLCLHNADITSFLIPLRGLIDRELVASRIPLWVNDILCGFPLLAEGHLGAFDPIRHVLALLTSPARALSLMLLVHLSLAAVLAYALGRRLGMPRPAAVLAATICSCGGAWAAHQAHPAIAAGYWGIPAAILVVDHLRLSTKPVAWAYVWGAVLAAVVMVAQPQTAFLSLLYSLIYFAATLDRKHSVRSWRTATLCVLALASGMALSAIQSLPTLELGRLSWRAHYGRLYYMTWYSFPRRHFVTFLLPTFYGSWSWGREYWGLPNFVELHAYVGLVPLLLAPLGAAGWREPRRRGLLALVVVCLVLAVAHRNPLYRVLQYVPGFGLFRAPARHMLGLDFALSMLAGLGLTRLAYTQPGRRPSLAGPAVVAGLALLLYAAVLEGVVVTPPRGLGAAYPMQRHLMVVDMEVLTGILTATLSVMVLAARRRLRPVWTQSVVLVIAVVDLIYFFPRVDTLVAPSYYQRPPAIIAAARATAGSGRCFPLGIEWGPTSAAQFLTGSGTALWGVKSAVGRVDLVPQRHSRLLTEIYRRMGSRRPLPWPLLSSLNVRAVIAKQPLEAPQLRLAAREGDLHLYENRACLPRAWLVGSWRLAQSDEHALRLVLDPKFSPGSAVILEAVAPVASQCPSQDGKPATAIINRDEQNTLIVSTRTPRARLLVVSDQWYPGWVARVDGEPTTIYRANYVVRAVVVPPGDHTVLFNYEPASYRRGRVISLLALLVGAGLLAGDLGSRHRTGRAAR